MMRRWCGNELVNMYVSIACKTRMTATDALLELQEVCDAFA